MPVSIERLCSDPKEEENKQEFEYFLDNFDEKEQNDILKTYARLGPEELHRIFHLKREKPKILQDTNPISGISGNV